MQSLVSGDEMVEFLTRPGSLPDGAGGVHIEETHISWVALTECRAYKVKKPIQFPFLDYSTLERRLHACREELRLGRRLAPDTYLDCVPITRGPEGELRFGGSGTIVNYCVVMERLPESRMLDRLIREGAATQNDIGRLLDVLVPFYAGGVRGSEIDQYATVSAIARNARQNLQIIDQSDHGLPRAMFLRVRASQLQFLELHRVQFDQRIRGGFVCDGHGDLRPEHVCMLEPPVVFDCVEFSPGLRAADVISELAFLAMELDFLGVPELADALLRGYVARTGDPVSEGLALFYKSYRACIRAKVGLLRAQQQAAPGDSDAVRSLHRARRYLQLASFYATQFYRPKLFVMVGATGTGKSTVADSLADALGLEVLRTDAVRHELARQRQPDAAPGAGIYTQEFTEHTYDELLRRAGSLLREAVSAILDGTFRQESHRQRAFRMGHELGADVHFIHCHCPPDVARNRIAHRIAAGRALSDSRPEMHAPQTEELESSLQVFDYPLISLDTNLPVAQVTAQVLAQLRPGTD